MANATEATMTNLTTMEAEDVLFNFTGLWISIGVLGLFVLLLIIYGLVVAQTGHLHLPQKAEDKEPLSPDNRDNDIEADVKKTSPSTMTPGPSSSEKTENAIVADEPPSYDKVVHAATSGQEAITDTDDCNVGVAGGVVDGKNVRVEVYEQKVDTADEMA